MASLYSLLALVCIAATALALNTHCPAHLQPRGNNLVEFLGHCYELVLNHPGDWYHARDDCKAKGGVLTDIHSYAEQGHIFNSIQLVLNHPGDWYHARDDCMHKGGVLTDIHSYAEQGHIYNSIQIYGVPNDAGIWIGMTDEDHEKTWTWLSGRPMNFRNWASGQPGMVGSFENCAVMEFSKAGLWHDYPCHGMIFMRENHGWVCKYDIHHK